MLPESHVFLAACLNGAFASISAGSVDSFRLGVLDKGSNWIFSLLSFSELPFGILFRLFCFLFYPGQPFIRQNRSHARKNLSSLFLRCFVCRVTTCFEFVANYRYFILYVRKINVGAIDLLPFLYTPVSRWYRSSFSYIECNVHVENYIELLSWYSLSWLGKISIDIVHTCTYFMSTAFALVPILRYVAFTA